MHVQSRAALIAYELDQFITRWGSGAAVAANLPLAYQELAYYLGNVGIVYQDQAGSKTRNPGVNGLHIGELLDLLHTLYTFGPTQFIPGKFWSKITMMLDVMREYDDGTSSDEDDDNGYTSDSDDGYGGQQVHAYQGHGYNDGYDSGYEADVDEP